LGKRIVRILVIVAVLVIMFGWLLPQIIDYQLVWDALTGLTLEQLLVLSLLGLVRVPTEAMIYRAMLPGLRLLAGSSLRPAASCYPSRRSLSCFSLIKSMTKH
jgi:uncharacterized membrane protein YbhN (UPF0104 family)